MDTQSEAVPLTFTLCNLPRWDFNRKTHDEAIAEVSNLAELLTRGLEGVQNVYFRMVDTIRHHQFTDAEIRKVLEPHFPAPRVSEFMRLAHAPNSVYLDYRAGLIGYRLALERCRGYHVTPKSELKRKKIRRTAERLVLLMGQGEIAVRGKRVIVSE